MTEQMIERVSTLIQQMHGEPDQSWEHYSDTAYAVLRDMRSPTPAMIAAAGDACGAEAWQRMIDAALSKHTNLDTDQALRASAAHLDDNDSRERDPIGATGP